MKALEVECGSLAALAIWGIAVVAIAGVWGGWSKTSPQPHSVGAKLADRLRAAPLVDDDDWRPLSDSWQPPQVPPPGWIAPLAAQTPVATDAPVVGTPREPADVTLLRRSSDTPAPPASNTGCSPGGTRKTFYVKGVLHWRCLY